MQLGASQAQFGIQKNLSAVTSFLHVGWCLILLQWSLNYFRLLDVRGGLSFRIPHTGLRKNEYEIEHSFVARCSVSKSFWPSWWIQLPSRGRSMMADICFQMRLRLNGGLFNKLVTIWSLEPSYMGPGFYFVGCQAVFEPFVLLIWNWLLMLLRCSSAVHCLWSTSSLSLLYSNSF